MVLVQQLMDQRLIFGTNASDHGCYHNSEPMLLFEMSNQNHISSGCSSNNNNSDTSKKPLHPYNNNSNNIMINHTKIKDHPTEDNPLLFLISLADNFIIEFVASLFVYVSLALFWNAGDELRLAPAATLGLVMLCLKDEDLFFPDASPTVTFLLFVLGGYNWTHFLARVLGQVCALGISVWFCSMAVLPVLDFRVKQPLNVVFGLEMLGSALEHLAVVYLVLPMLPIPDASSAKKKRASYFFFHRLRTSFGKRKCDSVIPPPPQAVLHAALIVTLLHYLLQRGFCVEVNPFSTVLLASVMIIQSNNNHEHAGWDHAGVAIWGQLLGVLFVAAYATAFAPRLPRNK